MRVRIILFDGFDELDAIAPFEVLKNASATGADLQVELATVEKIGRIVAAHGLSVRPDCRLVPEEKPDVLIVPGGGWNDRAPRGARCEVERGAIPRAIARCHESGTLIAGVCTGAMLIAAAGLLAGRSAATHRGAIEDLRRGGAKVVHARVVDDGDIVTSGGVTSGLDLALWLVERLVSAQCAQRVEEEMEYERRGTVWRRSA